MGPPGLSELLRAGDIDGAYALLAQWHPAAEKRKKRAAGKAVGGYGPGTRPNPHAGKVCVRGFMGCGQTAGTYDPVTQGQRGRVQHSSQCGAAWKASGAAAAQAERACPRMTPAEIELLKRRLAAPDEAEKEQVAAAAAAEEEEADEKEQSSGKRKHKKARESFDQAQDAQKQRRAAPDEAEGCQICGDCRDCRICRPPKKKKKKNMKAIKKADSAVPTVATLAAPVEAAAASPAVASGAAPGDGGAELAAPAAAEMTGMGFYVCDCDKCECAESPPTWESEGGPCDAEIDRYCSDDPAYRLGLGPSIERWGDYNRDESLVGLQLKLVFGDGLGECHGTVTGVHKREHGPESLFAVAWTCSPRHDEAFQSVLPPEVVVSGYFRGRERPDWMSDRARYERGLDCPLFSAPAGAQLLDFELPVEAEMFFPWVKGQRGDRWWLTLCRLNDPACAAMYAPGNDAYPLPLLLTIIVLTLEELDPSVKVPQIKCGDKKAVYDLADQFARRLAAGNRGRQGYGQLGALEKLVAAVAATVPASPTATSWSRAYAHVEALLLTLSTRFEEAHDNWQYADDPERIESACASVVLAAGAVLLHPPAGAAGRRLAADKAGLAAHIEAGSFVGLGPDADGFGERFPDAARAWQQLLRLGDPAGAAGGEFGPCSHWALPFALTTQYGPSCRRWRWGWGKARAPWQGRADGGDQAAQEYH
jgi:hypothetical protein